MCDDLVSETIRLLTQRPCVNRFRVHTLIPPQVFRDEVDGFSETLIARDVAGHHGDSTLTALGRAGFVEQLFGSVAVREQTASENFVAPRSHTKGQVMPETTVASWNRKFTLRQPLINVNHRRINYLFGQTANVSEFQEKHSQRRIHRQTVSKTASKYVEAGCETVKFSSETYAGCPVGKPAKRKHTELINLTFHLVVKAGPRLFSCRQKVTP